MKSRFKKTFALLLTVCMLTTCLTGCQELTYREAVQHYNAGRYDKAIDCFQELGDYEDSAALFTASHYWAAVERMEDGNYAEALPRLIKLGDYEDAPQRVKECNYQLGIEALDAGDYNQAEHYFQDLSDYRLTADYMRQINWQKVYDYILANGEEGGGCFVVSYSLSDRLVNFVAEPAVTNEILMVSSWVKDMGYVFSDSLTLVLPRESTVATFEAASEFTMSYGDGKIGSQQMGTGTVDLGKYVPGMVLSYDSFQITVTDNFGQTTTSDDAASSTMDSAMADHLVAIMDSFSALQVTAGAKAIF